MTISVGAQTNWTNSGVSSMTLTKPTGFVSGDLALIFALAAGASASTGWATTTTTSGWPLLTSNYYSTTGIACGVYWHIWTGSEGSTEQVSLVGAGGNGVAGIYVRISGNHQSTAPVSNSFVDHTAALTTSAASITPTDNNSLVVALAMVDGAASLPASSVTAGWTQRTGEDIAFDSFDWATLPLPTAGASGACVFTHDAASSVAGSSVQFYITPSTFVVANIDGLAITSVATIDSATVAAINTVNGVALV